MRDFRIICDISFLNYFIYVFNYIKYILVIIDLRNNWRKMRKFIFDKFLRFEFSTQSNFSILAIKLQNFTLGS